MDEQRMIDMELKIAHQDFLIEKLEKVVYEQRNAIDRLEMVVKELVKVVKAEQIGPGDEKPPHY
jgi:SlyX protein